MAGAVFASVGLTAISVPMAAPAGAAATSVQQVCSAPKPGHMTCLAERVMNPRAIVGTAAASSAQTAVQGYGPADLKSAYNLPSTGGSGRTVAIVAAWDQPKAESDLATYRANFGLSPCTTANGCFTKINQNGQVAPLPAPDAAWGQETDLDLDMVSAACASCRIMLVEASSDTVVSLGTAVNTAVAHGASVGSNS